MAQSAVVSVGMPVYNGERWITEAIDSVLAQTYSNLELLISDNASTDATERICREFAERDSRVRYHRNPRNIGLNDNYTRVFELASGKYFKWASSNDICAPRLIEACVGPLETDRDVVLCYSKTRILGGGSELGDAYEDDLGSDAPPCERMKHLLENIRLNNAINGVIRAEPLRRTGLIGDYFSSDVVLLAELALHGRIVQVPEELFFRRMTPESSTKLKGEAERIAYYQPAQHRRMSFQHWKLYGGYLVAATRAPLSPNERLCTYIHFLRRALWDREGLMKDVLFAAKAAFGAKSH